jgi:hypothetical protein
MDGRRNQPCSISGYFSGVAAAPRARSIGSVDASSSARSTWACDVEVEDAEPQDQPPAHPRGGHEDVLARLDLVGQAPVDPFEVHLVVDACQVAAERDDAE